MLTARRIALIIACDTLFYFWLALTGDVTGFEVEICFHHLAYDRSGSGRTFITVVNKSHHGDFRIIVRCKPRIPGVSGPVAKLAQAFFLGDIIAVFRRAGFPG